MECEWENMAKYDVTFLCGHTETVELVGYEKERKRRLWNMSRTKLCRNCYKKRAAEEPLYACLEPLSNLDENGKIQFCLWLSGNTMERKEAIKEMKGFIWRQRPSYLPDTRPYWHKIVKEENIHKELHLLTGMIPEISFKEPDPLRLKNYEIAQQKKASYEKKMNAISYIVKPKCPEILDGSWNEKIYGKPGYYSAYLDGEKVHVSDEEVEEIRKYLEEMDEYNEEIRQIKKR